MSEEIRIELAMKVPEGMVFARGRVAWDQGELCAWITYGPPDWGQRSRQELGAGLHTQRWSLGLLPPTGCFLGPSKVVMEGDQVVAVLRWEPYAEAASGRDLERSYEKERHWEKNGGEPWGFQIFTHRGMPYKPRGSR